MGTTVKKKPDGHAIRPWVEFVSDAIHLHRVKAGIYPKDHDLLDSASINVLNNDLSSKKIKTLDYHIALDGFRSLFNVGAIFRNCDAAGFKSIILGNTPGGENASVKKTSMGASSWVFSEKTDDLSLTLMDKKNNGYAIIGIETIQTSENYNSFNWPKKAVIVLGNEEYGISRHVLRICDYLVHIPMFGKKNSINVANAAAVIMFHVAQKLSEKNNT